jgi:Ca-activated chloride channel homolog
MISRASGPIFSANAPEYRSKAHISTLHNRHKTRMKSRIVGTLSLIFILASAALSAQNPHAHRSLRKADEHYNKARYSEAQKHYENAKKIQPEDWRTHYNLGNAIYQQGRYKEAAVHYQKAAGMATRPADRADVLHNLGNTHLKQQKWDDAVRTYEQALRYRPGDADTRQNHQMAKRKQQEEQKKQQQKQDQQPKDPQDQQQQQNKQQQKQPQLPENQQHALDNVSADDQKVRQKYQQNRNAQRAKRHVNEW